MTDIFSVNLLSSISAMYLSAIAACFFVWLFRRYLINNKNLFEHFAFSLEWISGIVPGILMGLLLLIWLPDSWFSKYILIFFACFTYLINKLENELKKVKNEYIDAAVSLGAEKNFISDKVCWKEVEPGLAASLTKMHFYLWTMLIWFEMIRGGPGLGTVLKTAILNQDLPVFFTSLLIICLIMFAGAYIIKYFKNHFIFWNNN